MTDGIADHCNILFGIDLKAVNSEAHKFQTNILCRNVMTDKNIEKFQEEIKNTYFEDVSKKTDVNEATNTFFDTIFKFLTNIVQKNNQKQ